MLLSVDTYKIYILCGNVLVTSVTVDFRRLYWLESFSGEVCSVDKKHGLNLVEHPIHKRLTHILAYSEGIQAIPGLSTVIHSVSKKSHLTHDGRYV